MTAAKRSPVHFLRATSGGSDDILARLDLLLGQSGIGVAAAAGSIVAVKMHFGESTETGHVRPRFVRRIVAWLLKRDTRPFLTDCNTLYRGTRGDSVAHLRTAAEHGYTYSATGAPVVIADGLHGTARTRLPVNGKYVREASFGSDLVKADGILSLAHFKGHEVSGFGGALKNVGMGGAARAGKLEQHSTTKPYVRPSCTACGVCAAWCPADAIAVAEKATIDPERCIGCAECIAVCPEKAVSIHWNESADIFQRKMVEYVRAIATAKPGGLAYVNFITDVHPLCDCYGAAKVPIVPDIGVVASLDPVAIDQASFDLVNAAPAAKGSELSQNYRRGEDKFRDLHPEVDPTEQLRYGEELGLGTRDYELVEIA